MPQAPVVTVQITYWTPPRANVPRSSFVHERTLEGVPTPVARRMLRDFAAYQAERGGATRREAYTYQQGVAKGAPRGGASDEGDGNEVNAALDFGEIVALNLSEERSPVPETAGRPSLAKK